MIEYTKEALIQFEADIAVLWEAGELPYLMHLSGGNEDWLIDFFKRNVEDNDWVFSTHRSHYHALLAGIDPWRLKVSIQKGDSMFIFDREHRFFTSAILAGTCAIAAGVAQAIKDEGSDEEVWCFIGDGAEEEGHFAEAVTMVQGHNLPCTFIIEDNDRASETTVVERSGGLRLHWPACVIRYNYTPTYPHAGTGTPNKIVFKPR
jgi:pyruvate dehydrogenase E1 component alpha subunit